VRFQVIEAVNIEIIILWDMTCSLVKVNQSFGEIFCLHLHGRMGVKKIAGKRAASGNPGYDTGLVGSPDRTNRSKRCGHEMGLFRTPCLNPACIPDRLSGLLFIPILKQAFRPTGLRPLLLACCILELLLGPEDELNTFPQNVDTFLSDYGASDNA
jgi:hypothetical protein